MIKFLNWYYNIQDTLLSYFAPREVEIYTPIKMIDSNTLQNGHTFILANAPIKMIRLEDYFISFMLHLDLDHVNLPFDQYIIYCDTDTMEIPAKLFIGEGYKLVTMDYNGVEAVYEWGDNIKLPSKH